MDDDHESEDLMSSDEYSPPPIQGKTRNSMDETEESQLQV